MSNYPVFLQSRYERGPAVRENDREHGQCMKAAAHATRLHMDSAFADIRIEVYYEPLSFKKILERGII
jgi:hypothetical protein